MPREGYKTVSFPKELLEAIQGFLEENPAYGSNPSSYCINAARSKYLDDLRLARMGVIVRPPPDDPPPE